MSEETRRELAAEVRETVPGEPGVYAFLDAVGRLLYVGKSVNLRRRVGGYFARDPLSAEPHLGRLVAGIRGFAWWQTPSELLALLLEDALIKEFLPPFNKRQKEFEENRYLELTGGDFPACLVVEHAGDLGTREVFGPLKDKHFAARLQDIIHETLGIRFCREPEPIGRCLEYDIGRCLGPCRGVAERDGYRRHVDMARAFLLGDARQVLHRLVSARGLATEARRYEEAARLQRAIDLCSRFEEHARFARRFTAGDTEIEDGSDDQCRFSRGALVLPDVVVLAAGRGGQQKSGGRGGFDPWDAGRIAVAALQGTPGDDRQLADRARIVCNWARSRETAKPRF